MAKREKTRLFISPTQLTKRQILITFLIGIPAAAMIIGLVLGPLTWASTSAHFAKLDEFQKTGIKTKGTIVEMNEPHVLNYFGSYYVDIEYTNQKSQLITVKDVAVSRPIFKDLKLRQKENIYFKPNHNNEIILIKSFQLKYLTGTNYPTYGKWLTIISYTLLIISILVIIYFKRKHDPFRGPKPKPYVRPKDL